MLGATYSNSDYQIYKETGNLNHFEEVIDLMMIDELRVKYKLTDDVIESIKGLDSTAKRNAILSLLDQEYSLYTKIAELSGFVYDESIGKIIDLKKNQVNKLEYIKQIILMLREYVKVGDVEKKKYGEVMTPLELVKDMLAVLPDEVWSNPNLKWLDPANGTGPFPSLVIYKLMRGLEEWEPNPDKRYKHIIENMIYVCELQPKNMFLWLCTIDYRDEYNCNIYTGSFLDEGFDKHMKEVWEVDKFDIILGNPPYQVIDGKGGKGSSSIPIYNLFIEKSMGISTYIIMVIPSRWFITGKGLDNFRNTMINSESLKLINQLPIDIFGRIVDIKGGVSYILLDNSNKYDKLLFDGTNIDKNLIIKSGVIYKNLQDYLILDKINESVKSKHYISDIINSRNYFGLKLSDRKTLCNSSDCVDSKMDNNYYKCYVSKKEGFIKYTHVSNIGNAESINKYKVFTTKGTNIGKLGNTFIGYPGDVCTETYLVVILNNENECNNLIKLLNTKLYKYLFKLSNITQNSSKDTYKLMPLLDLSIQYNDNDLYDIFNLNDGDISFIENVLSTK